MAYTREQWEKARGFYEAGLPLSKIKDKTGIARNTVSQRAKREQWEHGANIDYIEAKELIATKKGTISEQKGTGVLFALDEVADDNIRRKNLVFNATEKLLQKTAKFLEDGKAIKIVTEGQGMGCSMATQVKHDLQSSDYKNIADTIDKASLTLGVNSRFNTAIQVNNEEQNQAPQITINVADE